MALHALSAWVSMDSERGGGTVTMYYGWALGMQTGEDEGDLLAGEPPLYADPDAAAAKARDALDRAILSGFPAPEMLVAAVFDKYGEPVQEFTARRVAGFN